MKIKLKYNVGDTLRFEKRDIQVSTEKCPACGGSKKTVLLDGEAYICPKCHGVGSITKSEEIWEEVEAPIVNIHFDGWYGSRKEVLSYEYAFLRVGLVKEENMRNVEIVQSRGEDKWDLTGK